jgi:hypothetical protein
MKDLLEKIKLIYLPFVIISISFILIYTFLNWLLFIKFELFPINEKLLNFWFPLGLPWIFVYFFLSPRLRFLKFKQDRKSYAFQLLAGFTMAISTIIAQEYLSTATGKLTSLKTISDIQKHEKTKYYTLQKKYIDKKNYGAIRVSDVSGKNNEHFNMFIYVAMPILETEKDTSKFECNYWLGETYSSQMSNRLSIDEKKFKFKELAERSDEEFKRTDFRQFTYLEVLGNTDKHDNFDEAIKKNKHYDFKKPILLIAHNEPFEKRNGKKLLWFFVSLGGGFLIWFLLLVFIPLQQK